MKFAVILREAGYDAEEFKGCSKTDVVLYDRKDRIITDEDLHFVEKLFANCEHSYKRFYAFLKELEKAPVQSLNIMISENFVILFHKTPNIKLFPRTTPICPIDFEW